MLNPWHLTQKKTLSRKIQLKELGIRQNILFMSQQHTKFCEEIQTVRETITKQEIKTVRETITKQKRQSF